jgi:hypothetical protein
VREAGSVDDGRTVTDEVVDDGRSEDGGFASGITTLDELTFTDAEGEEFVVVSEEEHDGAVAYVGRVARRSEGRTGTGRGEGVEGDAGGGGAEGSRIREVEGAVAAHLQRR